MRDEVVRKVAQAIDPMAWILPHRPDQDFRRKRSMEQAVSAITALLEEMEEPTYAMLLAGEPAARAQWGDISGQAKGAQRCWKAMLSAFREGE